ncbi:TolC family protein [Arenimonas fontis]|uniref:TolC family protein n=1 Tax=Arenimonas fontis TaxID=2608255 RepID=A0A5B2Z708_9GAMM|nr:TolC family protein [Arenimonas fontis]
MNTKAAMAALWCCVVLALPAWAAAPSRPLDLRQAFSLTLDRHPDLRRLPLEQAIVYADVDVAAQKPAWVAGASLENVLGSGDYRGADGAELTLSLGSVLESPARREARIGVAQSRMSGLDVEAEARRLDLLAEVARRYLDVLALQEEAIALEATLAQRGKAADAARRRVAAGASPSSVQLGAEAALARAELELARTQAAVDAARRRLALMWGGEPTGPVAGELLTLPATPDFASLALLLDRTPELQRFASEARVREARLQLAQSQSRPDLEWQVGVRRLQGSDDWALMGGLSVPLGNRRRAEPGIRAARAELDALALEREAGELDLRATLAEAHGRLQVDALAVRQTTDKVLPALERAESAAGRAYRAGALSYLEWAQLQAELLSARRDRIAAARDFHRALIEIQRLTAEPFVLADRAPSETTP